MAQGPRIVLVPVDGSAGAGAAAAYAAALAVPLGIPVRLLFAFPEDALELFGVPSEAVEDEELSVYSPERFNALRDQRARQVFAQARSAMQAHDVEIQESVLTGDPAAAILAHAAEADEPMIVMGSRGLSRFSEMLIGSVSHRVLHHARCPVTIVHR